MRFPKNGKKFFPLMLSAYFAFSTPLLAEEKMAETATEPAAAEAETPKNNGKFSAHVRVRLEQVTQDNDSLDASATTVRARIGYQSPKFANMIAYVEGEATSGSGDYNSTANDMAEYSKVVDPDLVDMNQAYIQYGTNNMGAKVKVGRQRIILDNARFIGNVGWRQNEQTFGAAYAETSHMMADSTLKIAYITNVNDIKGKNTGSASTVVNLGYKGLGFGDVTGYAYMITLLETYGTKAADESYNTTGFSLKNKKKDLFQYRFEAASQTYTKDEEDAEDQSAGYSFIQVGYKFKGIATISVASETLGGDESYGFQTPLATKHAYNGWADNFLATPAAGLNDTFITIAGKGPLFGCNVKVVQHTFTSDATAVNYGSELDLVIAKKFAKKYKAVLKYASFTKGDDNVSYVDTTKTWLQIEAKY